MSTNHIFNFFFVPCSWQVLIIIPATCFFLSSSSWTMPNGLSSLLMMNFKTAAGNVITTWLYLYHSKSIHCSHFLVTTPEVSRSGWNQRQFTLILPLMTPGAGRFSRSGHIWSPLWNYFVLTTATSASKHEKVDLLAKRALQVRPRLIMLRFRRWSDFGLMMTGISGANSLALVPYCFIWWSALILRHSGTATHSAGSLAFTLAVPLWDAACCRVLAYPHWRG